jgi:RNA polymerase primary sigma factor
MNYLKFRANALRVKLDPDQPDADIVVEAESLLQKATELRDRIVRANIRLVISIVKKFVTPKLSFDDLLSDGIASLMHAVDKFDYDRGFRFSTYAYRVVTRDAYRAVTDQQRRDSRFDSAASDDLAHIPDRDRSSPLHEHRWMRMRALAQSMIELLDRREQFILRSRFALGAHRKVRTFQCLADKLGISKERVRQLEQRAIMKLQAMAAESSAEE